MYGRSHCILLTWVDIPLCIICYANSSIPSIPVSVIGKHDAMLTTATDKLCVSCLLVLVNIMECSSKYRSALPQFILLKKAQSYFHCTGRICCLIWKMNANISRFSSHNLVHQITLLLLYETVISSIDFFAQWWLAHCSLRMPTTILTQPFLFRSVMQNTITINNAKLRTDFL